MICRRLSVDDDDDDDVDDDYPSPASPPVSIARDESTLNWMGSFAPTAVPSAASPHPSARPPVRLPAGRPARPPAGARSLLIVTVNLK